MSEAMRAVLTPQVPHMAGWAILVGLLGGTIVLATVSARLFARRVVTTSTVGVRIAVAFLVAAPIALATLGPASAQTSTYGGTLVVGMSGDPNSIDPTIGTAGARTVINSFCLQLYNYAYNHGKLELASRPGRSTTTSHRRSSRPTARSIVLYYRRLFVAYDASHVTGVEQNALGQLILANAQYK
jgi:hypothetical protein